MAKTLEQWRKQVADLVGDGQEHLTAGWTDATADADKQRFVEQIGQLNASYPGGVKKYVENGKKLLADSKNGVNPLEGWTPAVPDGASLAYGSEAFLEHEEIGLREIGSCAFVLVAGGLGERLGFSGIKVALPWQTSSRECYLELYIRSILALQGEARARSGKADVVLPLAIMVSEDTAARTQKLLQENAYFGMESTQVTLLKQEKVPCLLDNKARLALETKDPFQILTKPHGHGDVHLLLHSTGTLSKWQQSGLKWVYFLQDTNALAFKVLPATLGISVQKQLEVNSVAVARRAKESIGGLMKLSHTDGRQMTANVEYNQMDPFLRKTVDKNGDVAGPDGYSPYPGSINQLLFALAPYAATLRKSGGAMPEFVNPKYAKDDPTRETFPATRLECMMQDYPKSLPPTSNVGFTIVGGATMFSPVKTNLKDARVKSKAGDPTYSAPSGEADAYASACETLAMAGVPVPPAASVSLSGVNLKLGPRVVIDPSFAVGLAALKAKLSTPEAVLLAPASTLMLLGDLRGLHIQSLELTGCLVIRLCPGAKVTLKRVRVNTAGWSFQEFADGSKPVEEAIAIRGYEVVRTAHRELIFDKPGEYVIDDLAPSSNPFTCLEGVGWALGCS